MILSKHLNKLNGQRVLILTLSLFMTGSLLYAQAPSHDPSTMIRNNDGRYWIFTTGDGVWCMSSSNANFSDWRAEATPFAPGTWPGWINNYVSNFRGFFWAPDVVKVNGTYYLYYSCAGDGAAAAIGLATAPDLRGPWTDKGMVYAGNNAIDPAIFFDDNGSMWMTWGNWQEGIDLVQLNPSTGKRLNSQKHKLVAGSVEGPALLKNNGYYYLFYQRGLCCNGVNSTYYIVVARSTSVTGPYTNERVFLPNHDGIIIGPGHIGYGEGKLTYHYYDGNDNGAAKLMVTTLGYRDGWPVAGITGDQSTGFNGTYSIIASHSGKALDVYDWGTSDGTNIAQWEAWGGDCQRFIINQVEGEWHSIKPVNATSKAIDVNNISVDNGANIQIWNYWGGDGQLFRFQSAGTGVYRIINKNSGKCLDVSGASMDNGANVLQWECRSGATNQMFRLSNLKRSTLEAEAEEDLNAPTIWPNPSNGTFTLRFPASTADAPVNIAIFDLSGRKVYETTAANQTKITLNTGLQQGVYILVVEFKNTTTTQKLHIQ